MEIYTVGGAVRDSLLGLAVNDRDWVVVGATPQEMLNLGYQQVGKDFPVFLHPTTHEEYALARTERKSGSGYTGFTCYAAPDVSLEEDLLRRDLTINAIAQSCDGKLVDPYGGVADLNAKLLRHVSPAFREDPLRVLRLARFAARFYHLGFRIAPQTQALITEMVDSGELNTLTAERVWLETEKALKTQSPDIYFRVLRSCGALAALFPEIEHTFGVVVSSATPCDNLGEETLQALHLSASKNSELPVRLGVLCHLLGVTEVCPQTQARYRVDTALAAKRIHELAHRFRFPNEMHDTALVGAQHFWQVHDLFNLSAQEIVVIFNQIDAWRRPERLSRLVAIAEINFLLHSPLHDYPQKPALLACFHQLHAIDVKTILAQGFQGAEIREQLNLRRIEHITQWQASLH